MKKLWHVASLRFLVTSLGLLFFTAPQLHTDPPLLRPLQHRGATNVIVGTVVKVYTNESTQDHCKVTDYVAEVAVVGVLKGDDVEAKDRIFVRYRYRDCVGSPSFADPAWEGQKGRAAGTPVQLYLKGNQSSGFRVCEPEGFADPVVRPFPLNLTTSGDLPRQPAYDNIDSACLKITHTISPGDNDSNYEFIIGDKSIPSHVRRSYHPEYGEVYRGSLYGIVDEVAGVPPEKPEEFQTLASLLIVLKENGWEAVDKTTEQLPGGSSDETITTINFRRKPAV